MICLRTNMVVVKDFKAVAMVVAVSKYIKILKGVFQNEQQETRCFKSYFGFA